MAADNSDAGKPGSEREHPPVPDRIAGRYDIERVLGRGGFGVVYQATDRLDNRPVALKVIHSDVAAADGSQSGGSAMSRRRSSSRRKKRPTLGMGSVPSTHGSDVTEAFKDEFRILTQLRHPNLATVYDFGHSLELDGFYFTQELVDGVSLDEYLKEASRETIVETFVQLARALDHLHALGLLHGDIKPTNVLVHSPDGTGGLAQAKLIDLGLGRLFRRQTDDESETGGGVETVHGTPGFSAPEQVRGQPTDARSDVYSLAATIYTACLGRRAFSGKSFQQVLESQEKWQPEMAGALLERCGPVVADLIGRMLGPDPEHRPQSARSIVLELLRREGVHPVHAQQGDEDRRELARVLVEHLPFVDRAGYLELLLEKAGELADVGRYAPGSIIRTVVISAPEGMGRQRLMHELRREVQLAGGLFIEGNFWSTDASALGPFASIVLQLATALGERSSVVRQYADLIELASEPGHDTGASQKLPEFLIACSEQRPFVLYLAELARGREQARRTFEELARSIDHNDARILLVAITQPHGKITRLLAPLNRDQVAEVWNLRPFSSDEATRLLQAVFGPTPVIPELVALLDKLTGGHPMAVRETLRVLIEESILIRDGDGWSLRGASAAAEELHDTLAVRSEQRLDSVGVGSWELASTLHLLEAPLVEEQLAELTDLRKERFTRLVDRLEGEGLIVRSTTGDTCTVSLAHESVRQAVRRRYEGAFDETRIDLAARIEELGTHEPNLMYLRGKLIDDSSEGLESVDALERNAGELFELGQPHLGAKMLQRMIFRLRQHGGVAALPRLLSATLKMLHEAAGALDNPARESAHYEAGILVAELLGDHKAESLLWLGLEDRFASTTGEDIELALERLSHAAEAAKLADDRVLVLRIANRRAEVLIRAGLIEQAKPYSQEAIKILEIEGADEIDVLDIVGVRIRMLSFAGQLGEARKLHDFAKPIATRVPVGQRQRYLSGIAFLGLLGGDPKRSIPETLEAVEQTRAANTPRLLLTPLHNLGDLRLRSGDLEGAAEAFEEALRLGTLYGVDYHVHLNRGFLGYTHARMGDIDAGAEMLALARHDLQEAIGDHTAVHQLRLLDAEVAHMIGQSVRARRELEEMVDQFYSANELTLAGWAQDALARIEKDLGTSFIEAPPEATDDDEVNPDQDTIKTKPVLGKD